MRDLRCAVFSLLSRPHTHFFTYIFFPPHAHSQIQWALFTSSGYLTSQAHRLTLETYKYRWPFNEHFKTIARSLLSLSLVCVCLCLALVCVWFAFAFLAACLYACCHVVSSSSCVSFLHLRAGRSSWLDGTRHTGHCTAGRKTSQWTSPAGASTTPFQTRPPLRTTSSKYVFPALLSIAVFCFRLSL